MSRHRELELLRAQENTLVQIHMTFSDQLNRLKVEELALTNLLRLQKEKDTKMQQEDKPKLENEMNESDADNMAVLDLDVGNRFHENEEEEESEESDDETAANYKDQLTTFLEDLITQQQQMKAQTKQEEEDTEEMLEKKMLSD